MRGTERVEVDELGLAGRVVVVPDGVGHPVVKHALAQRGIIGKLLHSLCEQPRNRYEGRRYR